MHTSDRVWRYYVVLVFCFAGSVALCGETTAPTDEAVAARKAESVAAEKEFRPWYEKYIKFITEHPETTIPRNILEPLERTFRAWTAADEKYVVAAMGQITPLADNDAKKKTLAQNLIKYCEQRRDDEALLNFPVVGAWYSFMQGRTCAAIGNERGAKEVWTTIIDIEGLPDDQRKALYTLKKNVLHDLVTMLMKARKYADAIEVIESIPRDFAEIFKEDLGKDVLLNYAKALSLDSESGPPEFEKGIRRLQAAMAAEPKQAERTPWDKEFAVGIAKAVEAARVKDIRLKLSAQEWYSAAFGAFVQNDNDRAIDNYRRTIEQARNAKTPLAVRLSVEPRAWLEMGYCHLRQQNFYEAVIAFQALRDNYSASARERWLEPQVKSAPRKDLIAKQIAEPLKNLDELLDKSGRSLRFAFAENKRVHRDVWNSGFELRAESENGNAENKSGDARYDAAFAEFSLARELANEGRGRQDAAQRAESAKQAAAKFVSAAESFSKIDAASKSYEAALFQAGSALSQAQALWASGKVPAKNNAERDATTKTLAQRALESFDKYEAFAKAHATVAADETAKRQFRDGTLLLSRAALFGALNEWEKSAAAADAYLLWEQRASQTQSAADAALLHKFRAMVELAASKMAPECDEFLTNAETAMNQRRKLKPDDNETFTFMLRALQRRYTVAAAQAEHAGLPEKSKNYHTTLAGLQENFLSTQSSPTLADFASLIYQLEKSGDKRRTADAAKRLLDTFDPKGLGVRVADDEKPWQELLEKMTRAIKYADLAKWGRCKADHRTLIDYLYDTRQALQYPENDPRRPELDRFNQNLEKAQAQLESIKKNYPDCQTLDARFGENGKALLAVAEEEIDFRRKISATREMLVSRSLETAAALQKAGKENEARSYRELANKHIKILLAADERPELKLQSIELDIQTGHFDSAKTQLEEMRTPLEDSSVLYFDVSKKLSEVHAALGNWNVAAEYPQFLMLTVGADAPRVKERWPDIGDFLKRCYEHGVKKPAGSRQ